MSVILKDHIEKLLGNAAPHIEDLEQYFKPASLPRKASLLAEGSICQANYFVTKGCLRLFFVNDKGVEQTVQFALEHWWLADYTSFAAQSPALFHIQAVEASEVLALSLSAQEDLLRAHPQMERYFRLVHQRAHAASQFRIRLLYGYSREELYRQFIRAYPDFVQRVPQYLLASFLGITPEYLSELRRQRIS